MLDSPDAPADRNTNPSIKKKAFSCPFCGAFTTQYWHSAFAQHQHDNPLPFVPQVVPEHIDHSMNDHRLRERFEEYIKQYGRGKVFLSEKVDSKYVYNAENLNLSKCFSCQEISVWIYDKLVFPAIRTGPPPNPDLPEAIRVDYEEARTILDLSPKGAAALLRLCIQKLCIHLEAGDNLNSAIAMLKQKGLKQKVVDALDIVRVIGNEAVHPGTIDLNDNRDIAVALFDLVNIITEEMISEDKHINALFNRLPEDKRKHIEERDRGKQEKK